MGKGNPEKLFAEISHDDMIHWAGLGGRTSLEEKGILTIVIEDPFALANLTLASETPLRSRMEAAGVLKWLSITDLMSMHRQRTEADRNSVKYDTEFLNDVCRAETEYVMYGLLYVGMGDHRAGRSFCIEKPHSEIAAMMVQNNPEWRKHYESRRQAHRQTCRHCGAAKPMSRCAKCKFVYYCGRVCQVEDYSSHKKQCDDLGHLVQALDRRNDQIGADIKPKKVTATLSKRPNGKKVVSS